MTDPSLDSAADRSDHWLGVPRVLARGEAEQLVSVLNILWESQGKHVGARDDASIWRAWFNPLARGARLRAALDDLPAAGDLVTDWDGARLSPPLIVEIDESRCLVTLEGRALGRLIAAQLESQEAGSRIRLRWSDIDAAERSIAGTYRDAAMAKLDSVIALRAGEASPLLPQAIGLIFLLLVNGNIGPEHGLRRPAAVTDRQAVDASVAAIVSKFAEALVPSKRGRTAGAYSLYSGYAISEARRRLGSDLAQEPLHLAHGSQGRVVSRLVLELSRRDLGESETAAALDVLVAQYEELRPSLAQYGLAQGRQSDLTRLREALRFAFREAGEGA